MSYLTLFVLSRPQMLRVMLRKQLISRMLFPMAGSNFWGVSWSRLVLLTSLVLLTPLSGNVLGETVKSKGRVSVTKEFKGWGHLVVRLRELGVDEATLHEIYHDERMPHFDKIPFSVAPREPRSIYVGFMAPPKLDLALQFMELHAPTLARSENRFGVNSSVVTAILLVESGFGLNTGKEVVLNRLSRIAGLGTPENIEFNYRRLKRDDPTVKKEKLVARARYLEETFTPEIKALISIAQEHNLDPLNIRGSSAGAFGIPQFLPSSYLRFAIDGNADGNISLFNPDDAIFSAANFLRQSGWNDSLSEEDKRAVIWKYNKSDEYISIVLQLADSIERAREQKK